MPLKQVNRQAEFIAGRFYHVYNRTVGKEMLFTTDENYRFFLRKFAEYLHPLVEIYAYCLLGNHFHFLVRIREEALAIESSTFQKLTNLNPIDHDLVSGQFRKFFQSYVMAFNKQQQRHGTLLSTPFKRIEVITDDHLKQLVYYIHSNPQKHGVCSDFRKWNWSSYSAFLSNSTSLLNREDVLELFGSLEKFEDEHNELRNDLLDVSLRLE